MRSNKAEEEVAELVKKALQLEVELDKTKEQLVITTQRLDDKEKALLAAEMEVNTLNRPPGTKWTFSIEISDNDHETKSLKLSLSPQTCSAPGRRPGDV